MLKAAIFLCLVLTNAHADVYKCEQSDGTVTYQETECMPGVQRQSTLLSRISPLPVYTPDHLPAKTKKFTERKSKSARKKADAEQRKRIRKQALCAKTENEIAQLNAEFRHGYTAKRGKILDKRLAACIAKKQQYCEK